MRPRIPRALAGGLAAAALTAALGGVAYAQVSSATPTAGPPAAAQQRAQDFLNALAAKLGKTPAEVQAAFKAVEKDRVAQAVRDGKLTQAQADQINARIDQSSGIGPFGRPGVAKPGPGHKGGQRAPGGPGVDAAALATFLGVQPAELRAAFQADKSLAQLAQEKGKTRDQLKAFLTQQEKTRLDRAVAAGKLTQAQADQRLAGLSARLDRAIDQTRPRGKAPGRGERGPGQGPGGAPRVQGTGL